MVARMANLELIRALSVPVVGAPALGARVGSACPTRGGRISRWRRGGAQAHDGISTVPVLLADGEVVATPTPRSSGWRRTTRRPRCCPRTRDLRAQARAWEIAATETMAPAGPRHDRALEGARMQPLADHFAAKYRWSPAEEARMERRLGALVADLARAATSSPYLVGDGFTRADLTVASMLAGLVGIPGTTSSRSTRSMRAMFGCWRRGSRARAAAGVAGRESTAAIAAAGSRGRRVTGRRLH